MTEHLNPWGPSPEIEPVDLEETWELPDDVPVWRGALWAVVFISAVAAIIWLMGSLLAGRADAAPPVWWDDPDAVTGPDCDAALANGEGRYRITKRDTLRQVFDGVSPGFNESWSWFLSLNAHIDDPDLIEPGLCVWTTPPTDAVLTAINNGALAGYSKATVEGLNKVIEETQALEAGGIDPSGECDAPLEGVSELSRFQLSERVQESSNNYEAIGPWTKYGHATGAYQYLDSTWRFYAKTYQHAVPEAVKYDRAVDAPDRIQDRVTCFAYAGLRDKWDGSWYLVSTEWHSGPGGAAKAARTGKATAYDPYAKISTDDYAGQVLSRAGLS